MQNERCVWLERASTERGVRSGLVATYRLWMPKNQSLPPKAHFLRNR